MHRMHHMEVTSIFQFSRLFPSLRFSLHAAYFTNFITTICALLHHGNAKHHEFAKDSMPLQNITWSEAVSKNAHFKGVAVIFQIDDPFERSNIRPFSKKCIYISLYGFDLFLCICFIYRLFSSTFVRNILSSQHHWFMCFLLFQFFFEKCPFPKWISVFTWRKNV